MLAAVLASLVSLRAEVVDFLCLAFLYRRRHGILHHFEHTARVPLALESTCLCLVTTYLHITEIYLQLSGGPDSPEK